MKQYITPSIQEFLFSLEDVITASGIVSSEDRQGAAETRESTWDDSWS